MAKEPYFTKDVSPHWPKVDEVTLTAMGRFIVAWAVLENQISSAIADVYNFDNTTAMAVTANLGTKAKIELFMAGIGIYEEWIGPPVDARDANKLATDTATASNKYRNMLAHGLPFPLGEPDGDDSEEMFPEFKDWLWARVSARKGGVKISAYMLNRYPFETALAETISLIDRWTQFRLDSIGWVEGRNTLLPEFCGESDE